MCNNLPSAVLPKCVAFAFSPRVLMHISRYVPLKGPLFVVPPPPLAASALARVSGTRTARPVCVRVCASAEKAKDEPLVGVCCTY